MRHILFLLRVGILAAMMLMSSHDIFAQSFPQADYCGPSFPCVFTWLDLPMGSSDARTAPTIKQSDFYVAGWSFNWVTGQQPVTITAEARTVDGRLVLLNVNCPPTTCIHWRGYRPDVARAHRDAYGWAISDYTGYALYFWPPPPLDTERVIIYHADQWLPPSIQYVFVRLIP